MMLKVVTLHLLPTVLTYGYRGRFLTNVLRSFKRFGKVMENFVLFRGNKCVTLKKDDMTTEKICRIFQVHGPSLYITNDHNVVLFPGTDGFFNFLDLNIRGHYEVHGQSISMEESPRFAFHRRLSAAAGSGAGVAATPKDTAAKVFQRSVFIADIVEGKLQTNKTLTVCFSESEASVPAIVSKVKNALGQEDTFILTDGQGNQILDSEGTRGSTYWKQKSRKVFAVPEEGFMLLNGSKRRRLSRRDSGLPLVSDQIQEVVLAARGLQEVSTTMKKLMEFANSNRRTTVSLTEAQAAAVRDAFACVVCKRPVDEPMVSSCCQSLIGCRICIEEWQRHSTFCPKCRADDFYDKVQRLTGLSDVLAALENILLE